MSRTLLACLLLAGCSGASDPAGKSAADGSTPAAYVRPPAAKPLVLAHEAALWDAYHDNVAAADLKYTGQIVEMLVRGKVRKGDDGQYFILAEPGVVCRLRAGEEKKAAAATGPLQGFRVRGKCEGIRDDGTGPVVILSGCRVLATLAWKDGKWQ